MEKQCDDIVANDMVVSSSKLFLYNQNKIFNIKSFGPTLHVKLDLNVHKSCRLLRVYDLSTQDLVGRYDYDELGNLWVDIPVDCLDLSIGLHTYALEFVNLATGDTFYQYFNYTIQDDSPEKPYIYMTR